MNDLVRAESLPSDDVTDLVVASQGIFAITPASTPEQVITMLGTIDVLKDRTKEVAEFAKERTTEWVEANGALTFGPFKWVMGDVTDTECFDVPGALDALMTLAGGSWEALARDFLAASPIKYGSAMKALGADAGKFFRKVTKTEVKDNVTRIKRELKKLDERYVR